MWAARSGSRTIEHLFLERCVRIDACKYAAAHTVDCLLKIESPMYISGNLESFCS